MTYKLTFKGYAGVADKVVEVEAADYWTAERIARMQNPGWHDVVKFEKFASVN